MRLGGGELVGIGIGDLASEEQDMAMLVEGHIRVGALAELMERGCTVITGRGHTIAVFYHDGQVYAVDNRCPHMGFPLDQGSVRDGILTCHWHHARFDLSSGGTFNLSPMTYAPFQWPWLTVRYG